MAATLDDGIVTIYELYNGAEAGDMPELCIKNPIQHAFAYETVGINRYYIAKNANSRIDELIQIHINRGIFANKHIAEINGQQFEIEQVQHVKDDDDMWCTKLSLSRTDNEYRIETYAN